MALRKIVHIGDDILRKKAKPVTDFGARTHALIDDMWETMREAEGVGLAAPQVGILRRVVVIDTTEPATEEDPAPQEHKYELINPVIVSNTGEVTGHEGCLSIPGKVGVVTRPEKVTVEAQDRHGAHFRFEAEGLLAKAVCHELDHLEGVLYIDIAEKVEDLEDLEDAEDEERQGTS